MYPFYLIAALAVVPSAALGQMSRADINAMIEQHAKANGVPASFVHAVVKRESTYNVRASNSGALGLMQIKHATARGMGYTGPAEGLFDPGTNLKYGVAYLAGAYRTAQGDLIQAYRYYNRGYYYAAKRQGVPSVVAAAVIPMAARASAVVDTIAGVGTALDPGFPILGYAPVIAEAAAASAIIAVPLPPRRPASFGAPIAVAVITTDLPDPHVELRLSSSSDASSDDGAAVIAPVVPDELAAQSVLVPMPPRRPPVRFLAATPARGPSVSPRVLEATALPDGKAE